MSRETKAADSIPEMVEKNPWWRNVSGPFPKWEGPIGCKSDGGGCHYARGKVGKMLVHTATHNRDVEAIKKLIKSGENVNEVEAAGNTPLHSAAYEGWLEGVEVLLSLGAKIDASNNAGDRPYHWAENMGHKEVMDFIVQKGGKTAMGDVLVSDHIPKVKDFFQKDCWKHHPKPHQEYMDWRFKEDEGLEQYRNRGIPGL